MYKSLLFIQFFMLFAVRVRSQTLLNVDLNKINLEVKSHGGGLTKSSVEKNIEMAGYYRKIVFQYPSPMEGNDCLIRTTFFLTKNKCFKYDEEYWGDKLAYEKINELKTIYPGLNRIRSELQWVDKWAGFEIDMIPKKLGNNNFASVYVLEFKNIRY